MCYEQRLRKQRCVDKKHLTRVKSFRGMFLFCRKQRTETASKNVISSFLELEKIRIQRKMTKDTDYSITAESKTTGLLWSQGLDYR